MSESQYRIKTAQDILNRIPADFPWLWDGFLRPGALTLFSSPSRIGKSTLVSLLLDRMAAGGKLAGQRVRPCKVFLASEETDTEWAPRIRALNLDGHVEWSTNPFPLTPCRERWLDYVRMMASREVDLYVVDSLQHFLPDFAENSVAGVRASLGILRLLQRKMAAVWALHHPNKKEAGDFNFRGSVAMQASVDIMMELRALPGASPADRRRILQVKSRYDLKPRVVVELDAAGTGYTLLPDEVPDDAFETGWTVLKIVFEDATERLTTENILRQWPPDYDKPSLRTLRRWLARAVEEKLAERFGLGRCHSPFRYALPGRTFDPTQLPPPPDVSAEDRERFG